MIATEGLHFHFKKTERWKSATDPQFLPVLEAICTPLKGSTGNLGSLNKMLCFETSITVLKKKSEHFQQPQLEKRKNSLTNITPHQNPREGTITEACKLSTDKSVSVDID